jgi:hypothetical protein
LKNHNGIADGFRLHATIHMRRKQQAKYACTWQLSLAEQFHLLTARTSHKPSYFLDPAPNL